MDSFRFDHLARVLAVRHSRRGLIKAAGAAALAALAGRESTAAKRRVTQATCGNVVCADDPGVCHDGCVCCGFANGNSRCMPPDRCRGEVLCPPGQHYSSATGYCVTCVVDADCPTSTSPCLVAVCADGVCNEQAAVDGTPCDDGNLCTRTDSCHQGACVGANPVVCTAIDQCHDVGVCDPASGICSNPNKIDGATCNDSNPCTTGDTCQSGECVGGAEMVCTTDNPCLTASCDTASGCVTTPKAVGSPCNDSNLCTGTDACDGKGTCVSGAPVSCGPCLVCDPVDGQCKPDSSQNGQTCPGDGNLCFGSFVCQDGTCAGTQPTTCTALDQCHDAGVCNPTTGICSNPDTRDGTTCVAADACVTGATCQQGVCTGNGSLDCSTGDPCVIGTCDPNQGCVTSPAPVNTPCDDGNACTRTDACDGAGVCVGGDPVVCTAIDQCHDVGVCNPANGTCSNPNKTDGATCNDGDACTTGDTCQGGECVGGTETVCTTDNSCLTASCDSASGCVTTPKAAGSPCDDNNLCTGTDACDGNGACQSGASVSCGACLVCDPADGQCKPDSTQNGQTCAGDGNKCFGSFVCQDGTCTGMQPTVCAAQDQCHDAGVCDPTTGHCSNPDSQDGTSCSNATPCNEGATCQAGVCVDDPAGGCTPSTTCLISSCDPSGHCITTPASVDTPCDDGNKCTVNDHCNGAGVCVGGDPVDCRPDECHWEGTCNPSTGLCEKPNRADGTPCHDDDPCTVDSTCQAGECIAGTTHVCTTDNPCMVAYCDAGQESGCVSIPKREGAACSEVDACGGNEACDGSGNCVSGKRPTCEPCMTCNVDEGLCKPDTSLNGQSCPWDGNFCVYDQVCQDGACVVTSEKVCNARDQCHFAGVCDPGSGRCTNPEKPNGTPCESIDLCSTGDTCQSGVCMPGDGVITCTTDNPCEVPSCDPLSGCFTINQPVGTWCPGVNHQQGSCDGNGVCQMTCWEGYGDCNGDSTDGCETSLVSDANNCGQCGTQCGPFDRCLNGDCAFICEPGLDPQSDYSCRRSSPGCVCATTPDQQAVCTEKFGGTCWDCEDDSDCGAGKICVNYATCASPERRATACVLPCAVE